MILQVWLIALLKPGTSYRALLAFMRQLFIRHEEIDLLFALKIFCQNIFEKMVAFIFCICYNSK